MFRLPFSPKSVVKRRTSIIISWTLVILGMLALGMAVYPSLSYFFSHRTKLYNPYETSLYPIPQVSEDGGGVVVSGFVSASDWFAGSAQLPNPQAASVTAFTLTIKSISLTNIRVTTNSTDLKSGPVHFPGTALPGSFGNVVIFGHSALPAFYSPDNPLTVFNPLLKVQLGDEIILDYDNIIFKYRTTNITEVNPSQVEVLSQNLSRKELTLITCTPLGTYWKRYVVRAEIVTDD